NGLSASISLEDQAQMGAPVMDISQAAVATNLNSDDRQGQRMPNFVANLRVDQAWGSAQIMGALHDVGARYNQGPLGANFGSAGVTGCTYPGNELGWAVGAGLTLKMPWDAKDTLSGVVAYSEGAGAYVASLQNNNFVQKSGGIAVGQFAD